MAASTQAKDLKGNSVTIETFKKWGYENIFGVTTEVDSNTGRTMVKKVWCRLCAKYQKDIMNSSLLKGQARSSARSFIEGTTSVSKFQVCIV